ncbi:hypothetical protein [Streptomyces sp. NPDC002346]
MSVSTNLLPANTAGIETDTSGWTAGANTTLSKSSRFYAGAASLGMTATAAGAVTATTSARVAVTAGTEYTAYAYFANVVAASGRTTTVRVDWYAAVSGGTALSSVTSAGVALPNATTWMTPPPILIATAPAGALYASVTVSCSGLTAGAAVVTDSVSFGLPNAMPGNLFPYNTSGVEVDVTGWRIYGSSVITRNTTTSFEGWCSLGVSNAGPGVTRVGTDVLCPVTAGVEYHAHVTVYAPVSAGCSISIRWYDGAGLTVSEDTQPWTPQASTWTRCSVVAKAPPGAVNARVMLDATITVANQVWLFDQVTLRVAPVAPGSLLGYNTQGVEASASAWAAVSGCTASRSLDYAYEGVASLRVDPSPAGPLDAWIDLVPRVPITSRQAYQLTPRVRLGTSTQYRYVTARFTWYGEENATLRSVNLKWTLNPGSGWYATPSSSVAPMGATALGISLHIESPETESAYIDEVTLVPGGLAVIADPIVDRFGAAISMQGLTSGGYSFWGLWRMDSSGAMTAIRGSSGDLSKVSITGDVAVVEDYEAPLGVDVRYYLKTWTTTASYRATSSEAIVIPEPLQTEIVLKDPGLPARQTTAVVAAGGQPSWTRKARQGVNPVRGRAMPIVISDVRTSREGTMTLITETAQDLADMWWLLETGNTILIQWPALWGERDTYVQIGDVTEAPLVEYAEYSDRTWSIPLTEVDRPIGAAIGSAGRTWQTVNDTNADWLSVMASATSWLDVYTGVNGG